MDVCGLHDPEMRLVALSAGGERVKHDQCSGGASAGEKPAAGDGLEQFGHCFVLLFDDVPSFTCQVVAEAKLRAEIQSSPSGTDDVRMNMRGRRRQLLSSSP
jgi:hypothetical protein